mmetsp:Transcript_56375/g.115315  ORF Transcript_56375/g.115315 Transcript_56375/m.115315 type:complete len:218 (-) Transcript_56375:48-701(-)
MASGSVPSRLMHATPPPRIACRSSSDHTPGLIIESRMSDPHSSITLIFLPPSLFSSMRYLSSTNLVRVHAFCFVSQSSHSTHSEDWRDALHMSNRSSGATSDDLPYPGCTGETKPPIISTLCTSLVDMKKSLAASNMRICITVGGENDPHEIRTAGVMSSGTLDTSMNFDLSTGKWSKASKLPLLGSKGRSEAIPEETSDRTVSALVRIPPTLFENN